MRCVQFLLGALVLCSAAHAGSPAEVVIPGSKTFPESVTSLADNSLIFGGLGEGVIYRARPGAAQAEQFIAAGIGGAQRILGVLADESSNTLWACSIRPLIGLKPVDTGIPSALFAFDLKSGRARASYPLPTADALCNDIATGSNGDVYVTDTANMEILKLSRGSSKLQVWAGNGAFGAKGGILDGIAVVDNAVLVNTLETGKLFRVSFGANGAAGKISEVNVGRLLDRPDGMRRFGNRSLLVVESGGPGRLVRVDLSGNTGKLTPLKEGFPGGPVAVTVAGDSAYVLEAQLKLFLNPKAGDPPPEPFKAFAVHVGKP